MAERVLVVAAGFFGAAGVALAAAAAHGAAPGLDSAALMLLVHAPALVGVAALAGSRLRRGPAVLAAGLLALGVLLFSGTLVLVAFAGFRPFPMAAPTGGMLMILGWLGLGAAALLRQR